jgi:hypothetical protein
MLCWSSKAHGAPYSWSTKNVLIGVGFRSSNNARAGQVYGLPRSSRSFAPPFARPAPGGVHRGTAVARAGRGTVVRGAGRRCCSRRRVGKAAEGAGKVELLRQPAGGGGPEEVGGRRTWWRPASGGRGGDHARELRHRGGRCNHTRLQLQRYLREHKRNRIISRRKFGSRRGTTASPWPQGSSSDFRINIYVFCLLA